MVGTYIVCIENVIYIPPKYALDHKYCNLIGPLTASIPLKSIKNLVSHIKTHVS